VRGSVAATILLGFGVAVLVLSIVCAASYWRMNDLMTTAERVAHFRAELGKLDDVTFQLAQAEIAHHSYLLTGDGQFLNAYHMAQEVIQRDCADLRTLMTGTLVQQRQLSTLEFQVQEAFAAWQWTIELWKSHGLRIAAQDIVAGKSSKVIENVQSLIHDLETEEQTILRRQLETVDASIATTTRIVDAVSIVTIYILILAGVLLRGYLLRRTHSEAAHSV
jgi:CHASE3 domain sensor protein